MLGIVYDPLGVVWRHSLDTTVVRSGSFYEVVSSVGQQRIHSGGWQGWHATFLLLLVLGIC